MQNVSYNRSPQNVLYQWVFLTSVVPLNIQPVSSNHRLFIKMDDWSPLSPEMKPEYPGYERWYILSTNRESVSVVNHDVSHPLYIIKQLIKTKLTSKINWDKHHIKWQKPSLRKVDLTFHEWSMSHPLTRRRQGLYPILQPVTRWRSRCLALGNSRGVHLYIQSMV